MSMQADLARLITDTAGNNPIDELAGSLTFSCDGKSYKDNQLAWEEFENQMPSGVDAVSVGLASSQYPGLIKDPSDDETLRISISKETATNCYLLFFTSNLPRILNQVPVGSVIRLADLTVGGGFDTLGLRVERWTDDDPEMIPSAPPLKDPRKLVTNLADANALPSDLRTVLFARADALGNLPAAWRAASAPLLLAALSKTVVQNGSSVEYRFKDQPKVAIEPKTDDELTELFPPLVEAAVWTYVDGEDVDTRHILLTSELARRDETSNWSQAIEFALASAKSAYEAYVIEGSRDTIEAVAELRKTVLAETQSIVDRTHSLIGALWKDTLVAATPFALRILSTSDRIEREFVSDLVVYAAAAYLAFSFIIQNVINAVAFANETRARVIWGDSLSKALTKQEVAKYADEPIQNARRSYWIFAVVIGVVYLLLIVGLIQFGLIDPV